MIKTKFTEEELMAMPYVQENDKGTVSINVQKLYIYIRDNYHFVVDINNNIYMFDGTHYKKLKMNELRSFVKGFLPVKYRNKKMWEAVVDELMTNFSGIKEEDFNDDENIIVFENGVLNISTGKLMPHDPKYLVSRIVNAPYLESGCSAPRFWQFLDELLPEDGPTQTFLLQFIGAILSNVKGWRYKKMLLLVGEGNTGKSKLRELITMILGNEYCMSMDLKKLNERFSTSAIYGKRLVGSGDMSYMKVDEMAIAKEITGGDMIFAEYKGKDGFTFRYDGMVWCNCNRLPYFGGDKGTHVYERFAIVSCHNVIPEEKRDPHLLEKLYAEKDAIINIAINRFIDTVKQGYRFTESEDMEWNRYYYSIENSSLLSFIQERCSLRVKDAKILRSVFNASYAEWCKDNNLTAERPKDIGRMLYEQYGITAKKTGGLYYYFGVVVYGVDSDGRDDDIPPEKAPDGNPLEERMILFKEEYDKRRIK